MIIGEDVGGEIVKGEAPLLRILKSKIQKLNDHVVPNSDFLRALKIISKYLDDRDIAACTEELHDAGLERFAKL